MAAGYVFTTDRHVVGSVSANVIHVRGRKRDPGRAVQRRKVRLGSQLRLSPGYRRRPGILPVVKAKRVSVPPSEDLLDWGLGLIPTDEREEQNHPINLKETKNNLF
jgi:hypothetical protein